MGSSRTPCVQCVHLYLFAGASDNVGGHACHAPKELPNKRRTSNPGYIGAHGVLLHAGYTRDIVVGPVRHDGHDAPCVHCK